MFSLACNLMIFRNICQLRDIVVATRSDQIREQVQCNYLKAFTYRNTIKMTYQNEQISNITTKDDRQYVTAAFQRRLFHLGTSKNVSVRLAKLVSLTQVPVSTSLRRLKFVGFIYAPLRRNKDVSNRSDEFMYQL